MATPHLQSRETWLKNLRSYIKRKLFKAQNSMLVKSVIISDAGNIRGARQVSLHHGGWMLSALPLMYATEPF